MSVSRSPPSTTTFTVPTPDLTRFNQLLTRGDDDDRRDPDAASGEIEAVEIADYAAEHETLARDAAIRKDLDAFPNHRLELIVVTHIDREHIEGILSLLERTAPTDPPFAGQVWFNGWPHLVVDIHEVFGAKQGEGLSGQIERHAIPWNAAFRGQAIVRGTAHTLPGGMSIRVLHPTRADLTALRAVWEKELFEAGLVPGFGTAPPPAAAGDEAFGLQDLPDVDALAATPYHDDRSPANCSSIALLLEYGGRRVLLPGDVPATPLLDALADQPSGRVPFDLIKLSHHGSRHTTSRPLIERLDCGHYVVSTNGALHKHPDPEAIARVITGADRGVRLSFNYDTDRARIWDATALKN